MRIALLFPGQGSQYVGMGREFAEKSSQYKEMFERAETVCGLPVMDACFEGPIELLSRSAYIQPAITTVNIVCYEALKACLPEGVKAHCYGGHSLGEYSALYAAGVLGFEDTIRLVKERGLLMEREGQVNPGGMLAVLGLELKEIEEILEGYDGTGVVNIANYNTAQQIVISGEKEILAELASVFEEKEARTIPLNVTIANHSPLVQGAVADFARYMEEIEFRSPQVPVYFNVTGRTENDPAVIKKMMASQIINRVNWYPGILGMLEKGVDTFIEVGPKPVLKGMIKRIVPKGNKTLIMQLDTPEKLEKCLNRLNS